jgi:hypothetical protein
MTLRVLAILLAFTTSAIAGGVDWSNYIEKPGESRPLPLQKRAPIADGDTAPKPVKASATKKAASKKRVARPSKAKTSKAMAKRMAKRRR